MNFIQRNLSIVIDDITISSPMKITATVSKDAKTSEPDFGQVTIINLAEGTRAKLPEAKRVEIYAGYGKQQDLVLSADVQSVFSLKQGTEWVTTLVCGDGATAMKQALVNKTYENPISTKDIIDDLVKVSGLSELPVEFIDVEDEVSVLRGLTIEGTAKDIMNEITISNDLDWGIQNDTVVVSSYNGIRNPLVYKISVASGMVGTPEWVNSGEDLTGTKPKDGYRLKVKSLCLPSVRPGDKVQIESISLEGKIGTFVYSHKKENEFNDEFKVMTVDHNLDSREGEFTTTLEVQVL